MTRIPCKNMLVRVTRWHAQSVCKGHGYAGRDGMGAGGLTGNRPSKVRVVVISIGWRGCELSQSSRFRMSASVRGYV